MIDNVNKNVQSTSPLAKGTTDNQSMPIDGNPSLSNQSILLTIDKTTTKTETCVVPLQGIDQRYEAIRESKHTEIEYNI